MKINHDKTKAAFDVAGFSQAKVARQMDPPINNVIFSLVLNGTYSHMSSTRAVRVINKLRDLGVLVEEPDTEEKLAA
jgi:hypothetical protein